MYFHQYTAVTVFRHFQILGLQKGHPIFNPILTALFECMCKLTPQISAAEDLKVEGGGGGGGLIGPPPPPTDRINNNYL